MSLIATRWLVGKRSLTDPLLKKAFKSRTLIDYQQAIELEDLSLEFYSRVVR